LALLHLVLLEELCQHCFVLILQAAEQRPEL
jgi:hypothetical protein